jgi:formylglycine-generating enzyme required for sulfatase activity
MRGNMSLYTSDAIRLSLPLLPESKILELLHVKPGTFVMGHSPDKNLHLTDKSFTVTLSKDFWLSKFPVTQAQWEFIMDSNPSEFKGRDLPVENISWNEANLFCEKINELYSNNLPSGYKFNLPTEAQWEYACRSNTDTRNYGGNDLEDVSRIAWHLGNSNRMTHEVGLKEPNLWGFHDMFGNVSQWCSDMILDYPRNSVKDWIGIDNNERLKIRGAVCRIARGGSYLDSSDSNTYDAATRFYFGEETKRPWLGFRLCLASVKSF